MLSIIIPARNEAYLQRTIDNVLSNARGDIEVIAVCDGYWPEPPIQDDKRVKLIHHTEAIGQRQSINEAARIARGEFLMKLDAHCAVDEGFDVKLAADCEYDWTVVPRMYNLDHETWKPKPHKRTDYMYIGCSEGRELRAEYYGSNQPKNDNLIDDTMCCMGPGWFMHTARFWELGGCDEGHGGWGQQGVEVSLKAWLSGGFLKVNKKTWFAHWFRGGGGPGFPYRITGHDVDAARAYSRDLWLNNKWPLQKREFAWVVQKFQPPGWDVSALPSKPIIPAPQPDKVRELNHYFRHNILYKRLYPTWRGVRVVKHPTDMILYQEMVLAKKPDFIVEIGTARGGSALMFADYLDMVGKGQVLTVDIRDMGQPAHPRIEYMIGNSISDDIMARIKERIASKPGASVMVVLDGNHARKQVKWELFHYSQMVTPGQYLVAEDCYGRDEQLVGPGESVDWFLRTTRGRMFTREHPENQFCGVGITRDGWLCRK